ncbi:MAG: DedA family protein [Candidatus Dasytiphilus stammeri]
MHIDINTMINQYGYWAIFVGCITEGETIIILSGIAAQEGLLDYEAVLLVAMLGGALGDQLLFLLGYYFSNRFFKIFKNQKRIIYVQHMICKNPIWFVIGVRFIYGFRIVGPIIIGASKISPLIFFIFNLMGALLWSFIFVTLGYVGGIMIMPWLSKLDQHRKYLFLFIIAIFIIWLARKFLLDKKWPWSPPK